MMATASQFRGWLDDDWEYKGQGISAVSAISAMRRAQEELLRQQIKYKQQQMQMPMYYAGQVMGVDMGVTCEPAPCEAPVESPQSKKKEKLRNLIAYYYQR